MTEATVLSAFMTRLRELMPKAVVVKHRDASMIGLPDFSVTVNTHVLWGEAKLYKWEGWMSPADPEALAGRLVTKARAGAETQNAMMNRLHEASCAVYVFFVKKSFVVMATPDLKWAGVFMRQSEAAEQLARWLTAWPAQRLF